MLHKHYEIERWVKTLKEERGYPEEVSIELSRVLQVSPSSASSFPAHVADAMKIYNYLVGEGTIIRNGDSISLCGNCPRIIIDIWAENARLVGVLKKYQQKK